MTTYIVEIVNFIVVTVTSFIPYTGFYVVKFQIVDQNQPFLIDEIECSKLYAPLLLLPLYFTT